MRRGGQESRRKPGAVSDADGSAGPAGSTTAPRATPGARVQSVDRAAQLLRAVAEAGDREATTSSLARRTGLSRGTAWRLLTTLESHGLVSSPPDKGQWRIGLGLAFLVGSAGLEAVRQAAHSELERVGRACGETAAIAVVAGGGLTYVDEVVPAAIVAATWRGRTVPLHATSTGKALLATDSTAVRPRLADLDLTRYTATTIVDREVLEAELDQTRAQGYAVCRGEFEPSAWGVSSAILDGVDTPVAVISVWGPANRVTADRFEELGTLVRDAARRLGAGDRPAAG